VNLAPGPAAPDIQRAVQGHSINPPLETFVGSDLRRLARDLEKDGLADVLGVVMVVEHLGAEVVNPALMELEKAAERGVVVRVMRAGP